MKMFIGIVVGAAAAWAASSYGVQTPIEARTLEDWIPVLAAGVIGLVIGAFVAPGGGKPKVEEPIRRESAEDRDLVMMRQRVSPSLARSEAEPLLTSVETRLSALTPRRMADSQTGIRAHAEASTLFERARAEASKPNRDTIDWVLVFFLLQQSEAATATAESWAAPDPGDVAQAAAEPSANETAETADNADRDNTVEAADGADTTAAAETSARDDNDTGQGGDQTLNGHDSSGGGYGGGESYSGGGDSVSTSE